MTWSIGPHNFVLLTGNVPRIKPEIEVITKPGEDGHRRRNLGLRSPDFELQSLGTYPSKEKAREALAVFSALINDASQTLIKDSYDYTGDPDDSVEVVVLDVRQTELAKRSCIAGTTNKWELRCAWVLRLVPDP